MSNVWKTLSAIDCGQHIEKKGNLSYLSWSWAWSTLMAHYPASEFQIHADEIHADGSVTVHCAVTVEGLTRKMWLPVMDHKNNSIKNPDSRKISDAKMRCLVKCIALFGLGLYIYAGEDLPHISDDDKAANYDALCMKHIDSLQCIRDSLAANPVDYSTAKEAWNELDEETKTALWKATTKGGWFETAERAMMKSNEWSAAQ